MTKTVKRFQIFVLLLLIGAPGFSQVNHELIFPDSLNWTVLHEGKRVSFQVKASPEENFLRFSIDNNENLPVHFDSLGNFVWTPAYTLVDRVSLKREFTIIFQGTWKGDKRVRKAITFTVNHVNQPPAVEELPAFYVKQSTRNSYQIPGEYVSDPDGDPVVFRSIASQMPEGMTMTQQGQIAWTPSRSQFNALRNNPLILEFAVQDQPDKAETIGKLRIAQTQLDLPPEILIVPGDSAFTIKEDETLNLKIYISDPNGDDNVRSAGFIPSDLRLASSLLKENTPLQYEFLWTPGYDFVEDTRKSMTTEIVFFTLDKSNNRVQRKIVVTVNDTENLIEKDAHQYQKYKANLTSAVMLINQLDDHQKKLNDEYKRAKKGKKKRSVLNATLGAATGISPTVMDAEESRIVSTVGGTTVLTINTLEATEVIGKSKDDITDKIKITIDIRNKVQAAGDEFARKFALKAERRKLDFEKEIEKLRAVINDQRIVLLEMDAYRKNSKVEDRDIKKAFPDFAEEN